LIELWLGKAGALLSFPAVWPYLARRDAFFLVFFHSAVGDSEIAAAREHGCFTCISCCVWPDLARKAALFLVLLHYAIVGFGCSNLLSSLVISVQIAIFVLV